MPLGFIGDLLGLNQAKEQRRAGRQQTALAGQQRALFEQTSPFYGALLQWMSRNAGLQMPGTVGGLPGTPGIAGPQGVPTIRPVGGAGFGVRTPASAAALPNTGQIPPGVLPNSALGIYGQNPADVFRLNQAEEEIGRMADQRAKLLQYRLGQQGIGGSGTAAAALGRNEEDAFRQLANFRRQLAMGAGQEQQNRMAQLANVMNLGMGAGPAAYQMFGNLGAQAGQQAANQQQMLMQMLPYFF